jgi:PadR family transcriptional regulator, regulatory protein PadR
MMTQESNDDRIALLQGTLDLLILKTLFLGPCHGQGVARLIQRQSEEVFFVDHGSLYLALHRHSTCCGSRVPTSMAAIMHREPEGNNA